MTKPRKMILPFPNRILEATEHPEAAAVWACYMEAHLQGLPAPMTEEVGVRLGMSKTKVLTVVRALRKARLMKDFAPIMYDNKIGLSVGQEAQLGANDQSLYKYAVLKAQQNAAEVVAEQIDSNTAAEQQEGEPQSPSQEGSEQGVWRP